MRKCGHLLGKISEAGVFIGLLIGLILLFFSTHVLATGGDNFNDDLKSTTKWGADELFGHGALKEKNHRLEYTCSSGTPEDDAIRSWVLTRFPYNADWEMQIDTFNNTTLTTDFQVNSFGIMLRSLYSASNDIYAELYSSHLGGPQRMGFRTDLKTDDIIVASADIGDLPVTHGAVRMAFNSTTKVISVFYDTDVTDDYQWVQYGSFGLAGSGGVNGNTDWGFTDTDQFPIYVYGYSVGTSIVSGEMFGDNFRETGGVAPSKIPSPTGTFRFAFNPLLTAIVNLTGNYQGVTPNFSPNQQHNRNYNIDVAQDESGKLSYMGTIEGIGTKEGNPQISGSMGKVATVDGKPTAQLTGDFSGTQDGLPAKVGITAQGPVEIIDIGGGVEGVTGTVSYTGKLGGVPFTGNNLPLQAPVPPGAAANLRRDWSLQLDISSRLSPKGKTQIVASAVVILPNGDTITFPAKRVKYSAKEGYLIFFRNGTNTTVVPPKLDKKTAITIRNMTLDRPVTVWRPTGGTITLRFLGQKAKGNLLDLLAP